MGSQSIRAALAGNPNCGKTTLFNRLTGSRQHVGNWPGATVEKKEGDTEFAGRSLQIVDLPGIYSLSAYSPEERAAGDFLRESPPDVIVNVTDASNLERNLYFTLQLLEQKRPMVLALNMIDLAESRGERVSARELEKILGIPVIPVSAAAGEGIALLLSQTVRVVEEEKLPRKMFPMYPETSEEKKMDPETFTAYRRYQIAEEIRKNVVRRTREDSGKKQKTAEKLESLLTGKYTAFPIFFLLAAGVFFLVFGPVGQGMSEWFQNVVLETLVEGTRWALEKTSASVWAQSLILDGVFRGVGSVLTFLPQLALLFMSLSFLEETGYLARAAFFWDRPLRWLGLSGRALFPLLMGFGCTVPSVLGTRILQEGREKDCAVQAAPFFSCSAKLPVYVLFLSTFFVGREITILAVLYSFGIFAAILWLRLGKKKGGEECPFVMELPPLRLPSLSVLLFSLWIHLREFLQKAAVVLTGASVILWFLGFFTLDFQPALSSQESILATAGRTIAPLFEPCGFSDWRLSVALLSGLAAKEAILSALGMMYPFPLSASLSSSLSPEGAFSYLLFVLIYTPCIAALTAIARESGVRKAAQTALLHFVLAWICSALFFQFSQLIRNLCGLAIC